jgi:hypothetical protein
VDGIVGGDVGFSFVIFDDGEGILDESKHSVWKVLKIFEVLSLGSSPNSPEILTNPPKILPLGIPQLSQNNMNIHEIPSPIRYAVSPSRKFDSETK